MLRKLWPALAWALATLILIGVPGTYFPKVVTFWDWLSPDKAVHVFIFGVQMFLLMVAFGEQCLSGRKCLFHRSLLLSITILFALLTEVLQAYVFVGRDGNIYDFVADAVGAIVGLLAFILIYKKKEVKSEIN